MTAAAEPIASNLVLLVPEAQPAVDLCNAARSPGNRLSAPAHITLVYPFIPPKDLEESKEDLQAFFGALPPVHFTLDVGWFGREVLLLRPTPEHAVIELTEQVIARWPAYPYYGGQYDTIEPHLSLAFGEAAELEPLAAAVSDLLPLAVAVSDVSVLAGPHERMVFWGSFPLSGPRFQR